MIRLLFCVSLAVGLLLSLSPAVASVDYMCPNIDNGQIMGGQVNCNTYGLHNDDCFDRCCKATGVCFSSSCVSTFNSPNNAQVNCAGSCQNHVICVPFVDTCTGNDNGQPHCLGFAHCLTEECFGHSEGAPCLYDGESQNYKICQHGDEVLPTPEPTPAPTPEPTPEPPGGFIVGDPQFVGLRGQQYQVHGISGEVYNIVSDKDLQYNSRFVFLYRGDCPVVNGKKLRGCWSHPGSFLGELGLKTRAGDRIFISSGEAKEGFAAVQINGKAIEVGETVQLKDNLGSVSVNNTHLATVTIGTWEFAFENSDLFVNQRVRVINPRNLRAHGLLGQTWRDSTYPNSIKFIQGQVDDYTIRSGDIFGDEFVYNSHN